MDLLEIDFKDRDEKWVLRFRRPDGKFVQTRLGRLHNNITQRSNSRGSFQNKHNKSYKGVTISNDFLDPQKFCEWVVKQKGWGLGYHLDKDLLSDQNCYSPENCLFLPPEINFNIRKKYSNNGRLIGAFEDKRCGKFFSTISLGKEDLYLGTFDTEYEAHMTYKSEKERYVKELAEAYKDTIDHRAYVALMGWVVC